jgi:hypothetical protein
MKNVKQLLFGFILLSFAGVAQKGGTQNGYLEWNVGLASIYGDYDFLKGFFPGTSVLIGTRLDFKNNLLLDLEGGIAIPGYATAKLGVGTYIKKENNSAFIVGFRPWPMHGYAQINFPESKIGQWILSGELGNGSKFSLYSSAILNFGYRWKLKR